MNILKSYLKVNKSEYQSTPRKNNHIFIKRKAMKNKQKITALLTFIAITLCLGTTNTFAQQHQYKNNNKANKPNKELIEAQKIAYITEKVGFTPAEAKEFWPVYNEYEAKRKEVRKNAKMQKMDEKKSIDEMTEKEAELIVDEQINEAQKMLDLRKMYHSKFKAILPATKVLKLYEAEKDFQREMIDKLKKRKNQNAEMPTSNPKK